MTYTQDFVQSVLEREQQGPANVLIKYLVPPPVQKEFIQVFKEVKDETTKVLVLLVLCTMHADVLYTQQNLWHVL